MTRRPSTRALVIVPLVLASVALAGCRIDRTPRRVPDDGAPCSAVMPGAPKSGETTYRLGSVSVTERAWVLNPPDVSADPKDVARYSVRRVTMPAGAALRDSALLDAAAARVGRGIALENETKPIVEKVATAAGEAIELRWTTGKLHSATRLQLSPGGYCEVTIMFASTEASVASFLVSAQVQARP